MPVLTRMFSFYGSSASSADNAQTTCRTPRPLRRQNPRASRRPSASGVSCLKGPYSGRTTNPSGDVLGRWLVDVIRDQADQKRTGPNV